MLQNINNKRWRFSLMAIILFTGFNVLQAQSDSTKYQARLKFISDSAKICKPKKLRPQLGFDNRRSFRRISPVDVSGYFAGVLYRDKLKFTLGYYQVDAQNRANKKLVDKQVVTFRDLELYYTTFNFEYLVINKRYIKLGLPIDFGFGFSNVSIYDETKNKLIYHAQGNFTPLSMGTEFTFKPIRWAGVSGLAGYRKVLRNSEKRIDFDGFFYSFGVSVEVKEIANDLRLFLAKKRYKKAIERK